MYRNNFVIDSKKIWEKLNTIVVIVIIIEIVTNPMIKKGDILHDNDYQVQPDASQHIYMWGTYCIDWSYRGRRKKLDIWKIVEERTLKGGKYRGAEVQGCDLTDPAFSARSSSRLTVYPTLRAPLPSPLASGVDGNGPAHFSRPTWLLVLIGCRPLAPWPLILPRFPASVVFHLGRSFVKVSKETEENPWKTSNDALIAFTTVSHQHDRPPRSTAPFAFRPRHAWSFSERLSDLWWSVRCFSVLTIESFRGDWYLDLKGWVLDKMK